jgi:four helix bundle protein
LEPKPPEKLVTNPKLLLMATIKRFEDLPVWQASRKLTHKIYQLTLEGTFQRDYSLKDQINRSTGSVMDNIAEGFERGGNKEFVNFLAYAKGSAGELRSQLHRALDRNHISESQFNELANDSLAISEMIGGFMSYLRKSSMRGPKFRES